MRNDQVFDPIFNTVPRNQKDRATSDRRQFLFDGWSYKPMAVEHNKPFVVAADRHK